MKKSKNYNMYLPEGGENSDFFDVEHMNHNTTIIDAELKKNSEHMIDMNNPHHVTKEQIGLGEVTNTSDENKPVSIAQRTAIDEAYRQSTGYTNKAIGDLIGGAPSTLDTLKEIADAIKENQDVVSALDQAIGSKASEVDFEGHRTNNTIHLTSEEKQMLQAMPQMYQQKDTLNEEEIYYKTWGLNELFQPSEIVVYGMYLVGCNLGSVIEINFQVAFNGFMYLLGIDWDVGYDYVTVGKWVDDGSSTYPRKENEKNIPIICMYKHGMYCFDALSVIGKYLNIGFETINSIKPTLRVGVVTFFTEKVLTPKSILGSALKQIGTTPLEVGDGTITGAINALNSNFANIESVKVPLIPSGAAGEITAYRCGRIGMLTWGGITKIPMENWKPLTLGNVPAGYRPVHYINRSPITCGGYAVNNGNVALNTDGTFAVMPVEKMPNALDAGYLIYIIGS